MVLFCHLNKDIKADERKERLEKDWVTLNQ
jgi:hypothetical protein